MPRPIRAVPRAALTASVASSASGVLHRRRQQVVVRAPGSTAPVSDAGNRRQTQRTLPGLGFREAADTLPAFGPDLVRDEEATPVSLIRVRTAPRTTILPPPPSESERQRPVTLLDDVHDGLSEDYLAEAHAILESGVFDDPDESA